MSFPESQPGCTETAGVLLEVILALVLFAAAATLIGNSLSSAMGNVERQRLNLHGANLAASVLAEIQMGIRPMAAAGPEAFEQPFEHWTWQLVPGSVENEVGEAGDLTRLEVVIRHDDPVVVNRLTQVVRSLRARRPLTTGGSTP